MQRRFYNAPLALPGGLAGMRSPGPDGAGQKRLLKEGVSELVLAGRALQAWRQPSEKVLEVFALDIELNAQGLEAWLDSEGN